MVLCEHSDGSCGLDIAHGLVHGLLIAIPLWVVFGIVPVLVFQDGSIGERTSLALMLAAVCESVLARPYMRALWKRLPLDRAIRVDISRRDAGGNPAHKPRRPRNEPDGPFRDLEKLAGRRFASIEELLRYLESKSEPIPQSRRMHSTPGLMRQTVALSALVGAYLQYYFLEVNLQISALNSVIVFLPASSIT